MERERERKEKKIERKRESESESGRMDGSTIEFGEYLNRLLT